MIGVRTEKSFKALRTGYACNALARLLTADVHVNEEESKYVTYLCSFPECFVYNMCLGKIIASRTKKIERLKFKSLIKLTINVAMSSFYPVSLVFAAKVTQYFRVKTQSSNCNIAEFCGNLASG